MGLRSPRRRLDAAGAAGHHPARAGRRGAAAWPRGGAGGGVRRGAARVVARRCRRAGCGRCARHPHDVARLGAAHAAGRSDRHRLRRHDMSRRHRLARVGDPLPRRHGIGHVEAARRRDRHRRRRPRSRVRRCCRRGERPAARRRGGQLGSRDRTRLLVNLSEPSQVARAAGMDVDGVGLLRAELMVLEALERSPSEVAARTGPRRRDRGKDGDCADGVRRGVRAAAHHVPHHRLPDERVPRTARRRALRAGGSQSHDRLPGRAALHP